MLSVLLLHSKKKINKKNKKLKAAAFFALVFC